MKKYNAQNLLDYYKREKLLVLLITIFGVVFNTCLVFGPIVQGKFLDKIVDNSSNNEIILYCFYYIGTVFLIQLTRFLKRLFVRKFANKTSKTMRQIMYENMLRMSYFDIKNSDYGSLMTMCIGDIDITVEGIRKFTTEVFDTIVLMFSYYITLIIYDYKVALISCIFIPIALICPYIFKSKILKSTKKARKQNSLVTNSTYELILNAETYRNNGAIDDKFSELNTQLDELKGLSIKSNFYENTIPPMYQVIASLGIVYTIYALSRNVINGIMTIGEFSAFITMFLALTLKASKASKLVSSTQRGLVSWHRIKDRLEEVNVENIKTFDNKSDVVLSIKNMSLSYDNSYNVLKDVSLTLHKGEILGVSGSIASGKSTFGKSLLNLYKYKGSIKINNSEISTLTKTDISNLVSYQAHEPYLLSDTIKNNITFGEDKNIESVLREVILYDEVQNMPNKENTLIGSGGVRLSGGQQSRLAMCRALIDKKKIIVLDDPISSVDVKTENMIIENLRENYKDSIVVFISHRLNSFDKFDKVLMLDDVPYFGTHEEVMQKSQKYKRIFELQKEANV